MKKPILLALRCCALLCFLVSFTSYAQNSKASASKQNSANSNKTQKLADIYIAGACYNATTKRNTAVYWKNGVPVPLTDGQSDAEATSMAVVGDDIYVLGIVDGETVYWKNGQQTRIRKDEGDSNNALSIAVVNGDLYFSGYYRDLDDNKMRFRDLMMYWKNGQPVKLPVPKENDQGAAYYIAGVDDDIYIIGKAGYEQLYWKNGQLVETINELKEVSTIAQLQGNVYAVGATGTGQPAYWKNGHTEIISSKKGLATCIAVSGSDVYIAGVDANSGTGYPDDNDVAKCWKNGQLLADLKGTDYFIYRPTSIAVSGSDVYIIGVARIGSSGFGERLLKNGQLMKLSPIEGCQGSSAHFVTSYESSKSTKPKQSAVNVKRESSVESEKSLKPSTPKVLTAPEEADLFFEENRKKPGVTTTASGLQYEILKQGTGPRLLLTDKVWCDSKSMEITGKERKQNHDFGPREIAVSAFISGLKEGILLMNEGSKYRIYVPPKLLSPVDLRLGRYYVFETEILGIINKR